MPTTIPPPSSLPTLARGPTTRTPSTRHTTTTRAVGRTSPSKINNRQPPHRTSVPHAQPPPPTQVSKAPSTTKLDLTLTSGNSRKLAPLPPTTSSSTHHRPPTLPSRLRGRVEENQPAHNGARGGGSVVSSSSKLVSGPNQRGGGGSGEQRPATQHQPLPPPSPQPSDNDPPPRHQQEEPENVKTATTTTTNFPEPALPPQLAKAVWNAVDTCTYVYNLKTDPTGIKRRLAREAEEEEMKMMASRKVKQNGKSATFVRGRPNGSSTTSIVVNIATLNKTGSKSKDAAILKSAVEKCKNVLDDVELPLTTVVIDERVVASPSGKYAFTFVQTDCVWEREGTSSHSMTYITVKICDAPQQIHNSKAAVIKSIQQQGGKDDNSNIEVLANYFRDSYSAHMDVEASGVSSGWSGAGHIHWDPTQPSDLVAKIDGEWVSRRFDSGPSSTWPSYCVGVSPAP